MLSRALLMPGLALVTLASTCVSPPAPTPSTSTSTPSPTAAAAPPPVPGSARVPLPTARLGVVPWLMPERPTCGGALEAAQGKGALGPPELLEASGMVASPANAGVLWLHNDSGDVARLFAVGTDGKALGTYGLPNVTAVDMEDMAAAPCPDLSGPCLYLADTGDNKLKREQLVVYAVPEPLVAPDRPLLPRAEAPFVWIFPLVVPERANIEALVVLPDATAMILFEKTTDARARVFRYAAPWTPLHPATVEVLTTVAIPAQLPALRQITGADVHPSGTRLVLRTYGAVLQATLDPAAGLGWAQLDRAPLVEVLAGPDEPQGEAVAWDAAGTGLWTVSESPSGEPGPPLHHAACAATP